MRIGVKSGSFEVHFPPVLTANTRASSGAPPPPPPSSRPPSHAPLTVPPPLPHHRLTMRMSRLFGETLRQTPAEAETPSHQLLLRAGLVHQVAAGVYAFLPLAWRVLQHIERIIREEMDAEGGQELMMPAMHPVEIWQASGRDQAMKDILFRFSDKRDREFVLGPTHEEVIVELFKRHVRSYRDLPLLVYQIQQKFRDEPRPRGGLIRLRQFTMKDLYSFDADFDGLDID